MSHSNEGGTEKSLPSLELQRRLTEILEGETLECRAAQDALKQCLNLNDLGEIVRLKETTKSQLTLIDSQGKKRYLFAYLEQLEKVINRTACLTPEGVFDA